MNKILAQLHLTVDTAPPGLEKVCASPPAALAIDEQIALRQAHLLCDRIDFVFFRRFADGRSSQVAAYVIDDAGSKFTPDDISSLHHRLWLSGTTPLLYVSWQDHVDVLSCAAGAVAKNKESWKPKPFAAIPDVGRISAALDGSPERFSAYRLADGTFWEDERNAKHVKPNRGAHKVLIEKVKDADEKLGGAKNPLARRLLLLTLLVKYLEDRKVFPSTARSWFSSFHAGAMSFLDVLKQAKPNDVVAMLKALEEKFNGDIFVLPEGEQVLDEQTLRKLANVVEARSDASGQLYFWNIYSFECIPVEVLSHIYQHFAEDGTGSVFTPPLLVNLLLDQVMPLHKLRGDETFLDPTCGSGIFLVAAFRRLIYARLATNNWDKPSPGDLKRLLADCIFGIELQEEAAHVASFSLALAICDALQPDIIWKNLRFDKLMDRNLFVGDFAKLSSAAKRHTRGSNGFDVIAGNPPFQSKITPAMASDLASRDGSVPDQQISHYVLEACLKSCLSPSGQLCMIQPAGLLYNNQTVTFRRSIFASYQVDAVLDFVSIRGLFQGADPKIVAIHAMNRTPESGHVIRHWTFRRTFATKSQISFELDHYDHHSVPLAMIESYPWVWRANLLGGGRLFHLAKRLTEMPSLGDTIDSNGWGIGEGYIAGKKDGTKAEWLTGMPLLPTKAFNGDVIAPQVLTRVVSADDMYRSAYGPERFRGPMVLIKENEELPCALWENGPLAYKAKIVGITAPEQQLQRLKEFRQLFIKNRKVLRACCHLLGSQLSVGKATAVLKEDIARLPWPKDGDWQLVPWEEELLSDIDTYMGEYVRLGQDSPLLKSKASKPDVEAYCETFLKLMRRGFPQACTSAQVQAEGLRLQAFSLTGEATVDRLDGGWAQHLKGTIFKQFGMTLSTVRVVRFFEANTVILIKPDLLRYWIRSAAIRDVDGVLNDIIGGDKQDA